MIGLEKSRVQKSESITIKNQSRSLLSCSWSNYRLFLYIIVDHFKPRQICVNVKCFKLRLLIQVSFLHMNGFNTFLHNTAIIFPGSIHGLTLDPRGTVLHVFCIIIIIFLLKQISLNIKPLIPLVKYYIILLLRQLDSFFLTDKISVLSTELRTVDPCSGLSKA